MKNKVQKYKERLEIKLVDAVPLIGIVPMCKRNWDVIKETFKREYRQAFASRTILNRKISSFRFRNTARL